MKKVNETAKSEKVQELLKNKVVIYRKDLIALELSDYEIKKLVSNGVIKKIGHGSYTSSKSQENYLPKSNLEEVKKAFLEQDEEALYKSFQNLELNEEAIKTLYPLLLSGLIKLQKEVEKLNNSKCFAQPQENIIVPPTKKEQQEEKQEPLSTHKDVIKDHPPIIESKKEQQEEKTEVI